LVYKLPGVLPFLYGVFQSLPGSVVSGKRLFRHAVIRPASAGPGGKYAHIVHALTPW